MKLPYFADPRARAGTGARRRARVVRHGVVPANGDPKGNVCHDKDRTKTYGTKETVEGTFFTWFKQNIYCPCMDQKGQKYWGVVTKEWRKGNEGPNTLSCPTQEMRVPHWTQPGQHPYTVYKCVPSSEFDSFIPDTGSAPPKD